jgi:hypothetical protein
MSKFDGLYNEDDPMFSRSDRRQQDTQELDRQEYEAWIEWLTKKLEEQENGTKR